ncbi:MAG: alpha/beta fold hydrolase [Promethearchaeota archaeon]
MILKTSDGIELFYETYGDQKNLPLLLIHGLGADHKMYESQIHKFTTEGLYLIIPDMRAHGRSSKVESFKVKDCACDLKELIDHLNIDKTSLLGVSMGGLIVQQFAVDFPQYVEKLIIVDSYSSTKGLMRTLAGKSANLLLKVLSKNQIIKLIASTYKGDDKEHIRAYFQECSQKMDLKQIRLSRIEINKFNILEELPKITAPTLVLVGDLFGKMAINMAKETAEAIEGAQFKILEGGGDPSNMLVPELFDKEVLSFLCLI